MTQKNMLTYQNILFETRDGIARLTLNRPDKLNCFTTAMLLEVRMVLEALMNDTTARVLVITGAGRGFCAGQDLEDDAVVPGSPGVDLGDTVEKYYAPLVSRLRQLPMPVVCAVNGVAAGAGANIALATDIVIASKSASFVEPFCHLGLVPDSGGTYFLPRMIGTARALGLTMLGVKLSAEVAESWGLIWKCVSDDALIAETDRLSTQLASMPTLGLARTKQAIYASYINTFEQQLDLERDFMRELGNSSDYRERAAAFIKKRALRSGEK